MVSYSADQLIWFAFFMRWPLDIEPQINGISVLRPRMPTDIPIAGVFVIAMALRSWLRAFFVIFASFCLNSQKLAKGAKEAGDRSVRGFVSSHPASNSKQSET